MLRYMPVGSSVLEPQAPPSLRGGAVTGAPDVVYVLGPSGSDRHRNELRYSLRSLKHVPHGRVWMFGARPPEWVAGVEHVEVEGMRDRYASSTANLLAACEHSGVAEDFLLFNDDFYVMSPVEKIPPMHRGYCDDLARRLLWADSRWVQGMRRARELCRRLGVENPLCYEVHTPMPVDKTKMLAVLTSQDFLGQTSRSRDRTGYDAHKRTIYANLVSLGGAQVLDPKVSHSRGGFDPVSPFLSTSRWLPDSDVARHIATMFATPCPYERGYAELDKKSSLIRVPAPRLAPG